MIGVTIGIGEEYAALAKKSAEGAAKHLGLSDIVILNESHLDRYPSTFSRHESIYRLKFFIFEITGADNYVYFDADCQFLYKPDQSVLDTIRYSPHFLAVRDRPFLQFADETPAIKDMRRNGHDSVDYVNAGFYVAKANHLYLMASCAAGMKGNYYPEQSTLNREIKRLRIDVSFLNRTMNWMPSGPHEMERRIMPCIWHSKEECKGQFNPNVIAMAACHGVYLGASSIRLWKDGWTNSTSAWMADGNVVYTWMPLRS